ncbi:amidase [Marinobacter sp.]|uniref:amidase n=3 Tax=Marinobacter sp. TaxID=50741 RepID=UPI002B26E8FB|nr:amidase [Marinobacter sp.]
MDHKQPASFHCFQDDALGSSDATDLAERIRCGEVSAGEVAEAAIARSRQAQAVLNGVATDNYEQARAHAEVAGASQTPFAGVPTFIKDNVDVKGLPSGHGSEAVPLSPAQATSPFVEQMLAQGYICLGKSTLPEFGFNASTEFANSEPTRNPWNLAYSSGASSGGSAAMVAAGVVPIAHANDGGGSIRIPAACCGLIGLKPTRGRVILNEAAKSMPVDIVSDGVVTRSVRDSAAFYAHAEHYFYNRKLPKIGHVRGPGEKRLRIGLVFDSINGHPTDADTRATVEKTAKLLEQAGHIVEPMSVPVAKSFPDDFALYWGMLAFGMKLKGHKILHPDFDKHKVNGLTHGLDRRTRKNLWKLPAAIWRLKRSWHDYAREMTGYDAVLTPVLAHTTPPLGHLSPTVPFDTLFERLTQYSNFTPLANATGAPAISVPMGLTNNNLPISVQFMAKHGDERTLLELAYTLEAEHGFPALR